MAEPARRSPFPHALALRGLRAAESPLRPWLLLVGNPEESEARVGGPLPRQPNRSAATPAGQALWLRPDRWLLLAEERPVLHASAGSQALDVDARYATLALRGSGAVAALAAGCGLDLRERSFAVDDCAQTRIEQVPAILLRRADEWLVMVERPLAHYFWMWVVAAARQESGS